MLLELERSVGKGDGLVDEVRAISKEIGKYMFPGWMNQTTIKKDVEREIRKFIRTVKGRYHLTFDEMNRLHEKIMENVTSYGTREPTV